MKPNSKAAKDDEFMIPSNVDQVDLWEDDFEQFSEGRETDESESEDVVMESFGIAKNKPARRSARMRQKRPKQTQKI